MKKFLTLAIFCLLTVSCFKKNEETQQTSPTQEAGLEDKVFNFDKDTLTPGCTEESKILCSINSTLKCTINPEFSECKDNKSIMPDFIFMVDESLDRPTKISYQVTKLKSLNGNQLEVYTNSQCNGNWFGLCNGTIIYVVDFQYNSWIVKDIYALAN